LRTDSLEFHKKRYKPYLFHKLLRAESLAPHHAIGTAWHSTRGSAPDDDLLYVSSTTPRLSGIDVLIAYLRPHHEEYEDCSALGGSTPPHSHTDDANLAGDGTSWKSPAWWYGAATGPQSQPCAARALHKEYEDFFALGGSTPTHSRTNDADIGRRQHELGVACVAIWSRNTALCGWSNYKNGWNHPRLDKAHPYSGLDDETVWRQAEGLQSARFRYHVTPYEAEHVRRGNRVLSDSKHVHGFVRENQPQFDPEMDNVETREGATLAMPLSITNRFFFRNHTEARRKVSPCRTSQRTRSVS
jgi:hypothetical protein